MHQMAPELIKKLDQTQSVDVQALGTMFWEIACGSIPQENMDEVMIMDAIKNDCGLDMDRIKDAKLREIVKTCRKQDEKGRPDVNQLVNMLKEL